MASQKGFLVAVVFMGFFMSSIHALAPTPVPSMPPTPVPSLPSPAPSMPSNLPTPRPSLIPSPSPTSSALPTVTPSAAPSPLPSEVPTVQPSSPFPTLLPSYRPTRSLFPTTLPTPRPSLQPTNRPSKAPSSSPTLVPSLSPSPKPTPAPSTVPSLTPSSRPVPAPSPLPTNVPLPQPTQDPTIVPTPAPTHFPSSLPTHHPTYAPTPLPTLFPTHVPSVSPSVYHTKKPTQPPSPLPTLAPTLRPSAVPTRLTNSPTTLPTPLPSPAPSFTPSSVPTPKPTAPLAVRSAYVYIGLAATGAVLVCCCVMLGLSGFVGVISRAFQDRATKLLNARVAAAREVFAERNAKTLSEAAARARRIDQIKFGTGAPVRGAYLDELGGGFEENPTAQDEKDEFAHAWSNGGHAEQVKTRRFSHSGPVASRKSVRGTSGPREELDRVLELRGVTVERSWAQKQGTALQKSAVRSNKRFKRSSAPSFSTRASESGIAQPIQDGVAVNPDVARGASSDIRGIARKLSISKAASVASDDQLPSSLQDLLNQPASLDTSAAAEDAAAGRALLNAFGLSPAVFESKGLCSARALRGLKGLASDKLVVLVVVDLKLKPLDAKKFKAAVNASVAARNPLAPSTSTSAFASPATSPGGSPARSFSPSQRKHVESFSSVGQPAGGVEERSNARKEEERHRDIDDCDDFGGAAEAALIMKEVNGLLGGLGISASTRTRGRMASNLVMKSPPIKGPIFQGTAI